LYKTTTMINLESLVNVRDAARQIGIHEESLRRLLRQGSPHGAKIGGQWFITKEQLALFATTYNARTGKRRKLI
jgi:Helix-turn-helix domain